MGFPKAKYHASQIVNWLLRRNNVEARRDDEVENLTKLKIQKLLYYVQGVSLAVNGKPMFSEDICAWTHGPVVPEIYHLYSEGPREIAPSMSDAETSDFNELQNDAESQPILDAVYATFGRLSAWQLREKTHNEEPWANTAQSEIITLELIADYFEREIVTD